MFSVFYDRSESKSCYNYYNILFTAIYTRSHRVPRAITVSLAYRLYDRLEQSVNMSIHCTQSTSVSNCGRRGRRNAMSDIHTGIPVTDIEELISRFDITVMDVTGLSQPCTEHHTCSSESVHSLSSQKCAVCVTYN